MAVRPFGWFGQKPAKPILQKAISSNVFHVVGNTVTVLTPPAQGTNPQIHTLLLKCEVGAFRVSPGDRSNDAGGSNDMPTGVPNATEQVNGVGSWPMATGDELILSAGEASVWTVVGSAGGSVLTYCWI